MILLIPAIVLSGMVIYFAAGNASTPKNQPANDQAGAFIPQSVDTLMWPDATSFNLTDGTFSAKDLESGETIKIATNDSTRFYKIVNEKPAPGDYFDFKEFRFLMESWSGPSWRFTLKGSDQSDGSIMASEIFYTIQ